MSNKSWFSIILPTFNSEAFLENCLNSIYCQTFKNYEVVIIDGKSTDSTLNIIKQYSGKIENLKLISEPDKGIYDAMNKGIKVATGEYLLFLGSDDTLYKSTTLENVSKANVINTADVFYGNVMSQRFNGVYDGEFSYYKLSKKNICHQAIFFKKSVFKTIGLFNLKYKSHADWDHNIRWFFSSKISKQFIDIIITNYADGGYSSLNKDLEFEKNKNRTLLIKGIGKLSFYHYRTIFKREIRRRLNLVNTNNA